MLTANLETNNQVLLSWKDNADNESGFRILRGIGSAGLTELTTVGADIVQFLDVAPQAGETNQYVVLAFNDVGDSSESNASAVFVPKEEAPQAPGELTATLIAETSVQLQWGDLSDNEDGYVLERMQGDGEWSILARLEANLTSYTDNTIVLGESYSYRVYATNAYGDSTYSNEAVIATALPGNLFTMSAGVMLDGGGDILVGSFVLRGPMPKTICLRTVGNRLALDEGLEDPELTLIKGTDVENPIAYNNDWMDDKMQDKLTLGIIPASPKDSMILVTVEEPGVYSALVRGVSSDTGYAVVEAYEVSDKGKVRIMNFVARGTVVSNDDLQIGSFIIEGDRPRRVFIRVSGPSLPDVLVSRLMDPTLTLVRGSDVNNPIAKVDDWTEYRDQIEKSELKPLSEKEPAIIATLEPGVYTALVRGANDSSGFSIVEVYDYPE